jgi:hypothetical protein
MSAFASTGALLGGAGLNEISPLIWREPLAFENQRQLLGTESAASESAFDE